MEVFDYGRATDAVVEPGTVDEERTLRSIGFMILKGLSIISSQLDEIYMAIPENERRK